MVLVLLLEAGVRGLLPLVVEEGLVGVLGQLVVRQFKSDGLRVVPDDEELGVSQVRGGVGGSDQVVPLLEDEVRPCEGLDEGDLAAPEVVRRDVGEELGLHVLTEVACSQRLRHLDLPYRA